VVIHFTKTLLLKISFFKEIYIANTFIISESMKNIKHSLSSLSFIFLLVQKFKKWFLQSEYYSLKQFLVHTQPVLQ
jgi:hypothetical protein